MSTIYLLYFPRVFGGTVPGGNSSKELPPGVRLLHGSTLLHPPGKQVSRKRRKQVPGHPGKNWLV